MTAAAAASSRWLLVMSLVMALLPHITKAFAIDPTVVTDLRVVYGASKDAAKEACAAMCPCRDVLTKHVTSNWFMVGDNLNTDAEAAATDNATVDNTPTTSGSDHAAFVYLCMRQDRRTAVLKNGASLYALQSVAVLEAASPQKCPSSMKTLFAPRKGVVVCMQLAPMKHALATGMYVSDIGATSSFTSGWTSVPVSAHTARYDSESPIRPVYIQYKRPERPILGVRLLQNVDSSSSGATACRIRLNASWEQAGSGSILMFDGLKQVLCVQRAFATAEDDEGTASASRVLTHVAVIASTEADSSCPSGYEEEDGLLASAWKICLEYSDGTATTPPATFISQLLLVNRSPQVLEEESPMEWPTDLSLVVDADLNQSRGGTISTFLLYQTSTAVEDKPQRQLKSSKKKKEAKKTVIPLANKPPLYARSTDVYNDSPVDPTNSNLRGNQQPTANDAAATEQRQQQLTFKILQLADLHLTGDPDRWCRNPPIERAQCGMMCTESLTTAFVHDLLDQEKPDFVVFSGDGLSVPEWHLKDPALEAALGPVEERGIPYAWIMGNHDDDYVYTRQEIMGKLVQRELAYTESGPESIQGVGNYELSIQAPSSGPWGTKGDPIFRIYFLDSNRNRDEKLFPDIKSRYDWIRAEQIQFYRNLSQFHHGHDPQFIPAIMFFHIPIPEYAKSGPQYARHGSKHEKTEGPGFNSGLFDTLVKLNEVKATFVGHDHTNDYCFKQRGIQLCYGGGTGFGAAIGSGAVARRARIIEWSVDSHNRRQIKSWKRTFGSAFKKRHQEEVLYTEIQ